jgi:hypothetical protein
VRVARERAIMALTNFILEEWSESDGVIVLNSAEAALLLSSRRHLIAIVQRQALQRMRIVV